MTTLFDLHHKTAWVTGAGAGGLGHHHALILATEGADLVISDLASRASDLDETRRKLAAINTRVLTLNADVSKEDEVDSAIRMIENEFGKLDILVNNAAISIDQPALQMGLEDWNRVISVNLTGVWLCSKMAAKLMVAKKIEGRVINVASIYGRQADLEPSAPYYATKAAVMNLTRALAAEWAQYGINVNAIAPGYFPTRMTRFVEEDPEIKGRFLRRILLKRPGDPAKDLAGVLILLASDASAYITGQTIFVDGGWTAV